MMINGCHTAFMKDKTELYKAIGFKFTSKNKEMNCLKRTLKLSYDP